MTLVAPKRIPRCALTGAPLLPDSLKVRVPEPPLKRRKPGYLETVADAGAVAAPLTLHRSETDGGGLGGLLYSAMMLQFLELALHERRAQLRAEDRAELLKALAWWENDYGMRRVRAGLLRRLPSDAVDHILEVVLTCHREQSDPDAIGQRFGHRPGWVERKAELCMKIALHHQGACQCVACVARRREQPNHWR